MPRCTTESRIGIIQFHPEASAQTLGASWAQSKPELCDAYDDGDAGDQLIEIFFTVVKRETR